MRRPIPRSPVCNKLLFPFLQLVFSVSLSLNMRFVNDAFHIVDLWLPAFLHKMTKKGLWVKTAQNRCVMGNHSEKFVLVHVLFMVFLIQLWFNSEGSVLCDVISATEIISFYHFVPLFLVYFICFSHGFRSSIRYHICSFNMNVNKAV